MTGRRGVRTTTAATTAAVLALTGLTGLTVLTGGAAQAATPRYGTSTVQVGTDQVVDHRLVRSWVDDLDDESEVVAFPADATTVRLTLPADVRSLAPSGRLEGTVEVRGTSCASQDAITSAAGVLVVDLAVVARCATETATTVVEVETGWTRGGRAPELEVDLRVVLVAVEPAGESVHAVVLPSPHRSKDEWYYAAAADTGQGVVLQLGTADLVDAGLVGVELTRGGTRVPVAVPFERTGAAEVRVTVPTEARAGDVLVVRLGVRPDAPSGVSHILALTLADRALTVEEAFVVRAYQDLLARSPEDDALAGWSGLLVSDDSYGTVANGLVASAEYRARLVDAAYVRYLGRAPDTAGAIGWEAALDAGEGVQRLEAGILGSQEYRARAGGTDEAWVNALYRDLLGREGSPGDVGWWVAQAGSQGPDAVVRAILHSAEHQTMLVAGYYRTFLHREPDDAGLAAWAGAMQAGMPTETVVEQFVGSAEYRAQVAP